MRGHPKALDLEKCSRGWETQREYCYWIPTADIVGEVPKDLHGTLFRNGPGVQEVYGTSLKHRKSLSIFTSLKAELIINTQYIKTN